MISSKTFQLLIRTATLALVLLMSGLVTTGRVSAAGSTGPAPPGTYHVQYYCGTGPYSPGTYTAYPTPQSGMTCYTMYFCVDPTSQWGVREVTQPVPTEACYNTVQEAYAAIGVNYNCGVSIGPNAPSNVVSYEVCPGGLTVSAGTGGCSLSDLPPGTVAGAVVGVVYTVPCPGPEQSGTGSTTSQSSSRHTASKWNPERTQAKLARRRLADALQTLSS